MPLLFDIGFLPVRILDILDILIVGYLIYWIYRLLRGTIAFNIFIGVTTLYVVWRLVTLLEMDLLSVFLGQFVSVGVILLIVIFQPEVRRFLVLLGNTTLRHRFNFLGILLDKDEHGSSAEGLKEIQFIKKALLRMARSKTGALIVFAKKPDTEFFGNSGVKLDALISQPLIESIFSKESPLHDGAMIIADRKIHAASSILHVSANKRLPKWVGLRHRAAVGATETTNAAVFIVSEETGRISFALDGILQYGLTETQLIELLQKHYS